MRAILFTLVHRASFTILVDRGSDTKVRNQIIIVKFAKIIEVFERNMPKEYNYYIISGEEILPCNQTGSVLKGGCFCCDV